jgi:hypothetical protein
MSRIVDPDKVWGEKSLRGPLNDWRAYCDGQAHELKRGVDLDGSVSVSSKRSSFRQWSKRAGLDTAKVHTAVPDDDTLVIMVEARTLMDLGWPVDEEAAKKAGEARAREVLAARSSSEHARTARRGYT